MSSFVYVPHQSVVEDQKRRGRLGITRGQGLFIVILVVLFSYLLTSFVFATEETASEVRHKVITIQDGDSLWKIASRNATELGMTTSELIDRIMELNHLDNAIIYAGRNLKIPIKQQ